MKVSILKALAAASLALALGSCATTNPRPAMERRTSARDAMAERLDDADTITVILVGTSNPMSLDRAQTATAVFVNGRFFLFDCGDGSERAMEALNLPVARLDAIFITHFHADHFADLGEAIDRSFVMGRRKPLTVYGPTGVRDLVDGFLGAYAAEFRARTDHHGAAMMPPEFAGARSVEFDGDAEGIVVYEEDGVRVSSFKASHPPIEPNVGYVVEYRGKKVVLSGDTLVTDALRKRAEGAALLVGDAMNKDLIAAMEQAYREMDNPFMAAVMHDIRDYHMDIRELAELSRDAGVERLALHHLSPPPPNRLAMRRYFEGPIRSIYHGRLYAGDDGLAVEIPLD